MAGRDNQADMRADLRIERLTAMYRRAVAGWASALLSHHPLAVWPEPAKPADDRSRRWRWLYAGSVLDD